jgi:ubiquinone biosynthesis monooxygenase Coq7
MIRVNHAGEFGAKVIYDGQIAALTLRNDHQSLKLIKHMKKQEDKHFEYFNQEIINQKINPTIMQPIWRLGGFALGFATAIINKKAAMACIVAVEEVIDEHYQKQLTELEEIKQIENKKNSIDEFTSLAKKISQFRNEELEHRDIGYENNATDISYYQPLTTAIKLASKLAIFISSKI